ncbi:MAG: hypothetical protein ACJAWL_002915 [Motiliproteus sp.]|jgi:hypothetical protein
MTAPALNPALNLAPAAPVTTPAAALNLDPAAAPVSLEQLRDLQLPDPIGLWPPAPGWWLLALLSAGLLCWLGLWLYHYWQRNRYRNQALQELTRLDKLRQQSPQLWLQQLNQLLRRTALAAYPPQTIAPLSGAAWVDFLYRSSRLEAFHQSPGTTLACGPYQQAISIDTLALRQLAHAWIRRHKRRMIDADA